MYNINTRSRKKTLEVFEIVIVVNFPKLMMGTKTQTQKTQRTPSRINAPPLKKKQVRNIILKLQKNKTKKKRFFLRKPKGKKDTLPIVKQG